MIAIESQQLPQKRLESDSSSESSQQDIDDLMKNKLREKSKTSNRQNRAKGRQICVLACLGSMIILVLIFLLGRSSTDNKQILQDQDLNIRPKKKTIDRPQKASSKPSQGYQIAQEPIKLSLKGLNDSVKVGPAYFLNESISLVNDHWFMLKQVTCVPDTIVNSATKIGEGLYVQQTAYEDINAIQHTVSIPAVDIYSLEPARQFMANISQNYPEYTLAFDHFNPQLLTITIPYFLKGVFVSDRQDWPLFSKNLVLNDLLPFANLVSHSKLIQSNSYQILLTHEMSLVLDLIINKKRQILIIIQFREPTKIQTAYLLQMAIFTLSQGTQCQQRAFQLFEEANWRIDQTAYLLPGWYVFSNKDRDIAFGMKHYDYEVPLTMQHPVRCISSKEYEPRIGHFESNQIDIISMPYNSLYLFDSKLEVPSEHFRAVHAYLTKNVPQGTVYLESGPLYLLLVVIASLPNTAQIVLSEDYSQMTALKKHLVVNNQEKVTTKTKSEASKSTFDITVTSEAQSFNEVKSKNYLLWNQQESKVLKPFRYTQLVQKECQFPQMKTMSSQALPKGLFLVSR